MLPESLRIIKNNEENQTKKAVGKIEKRNIEIEKGKIIAETVQIERTIIDPLLVFSKIPALSIDFLTRRMNI